MRLYRVEFLHSLGQKERNNLSVGGGACSDDMAASAGIHHGSGVVMDKPRNGFLKLLRPCLAGADLGKPE